MGTVVGSGAELDPKLPEVMTAFYQSLYPFKAIYSWLSHSYSPGNAQGGPASGANGTTGGSAVGGSGTGPIPKTVPAWTHREFAFTLQNDAYLRYLSFDDAAGLKQQVLKLVPQRFEIGAIYNARVCHLFPVFVFPLSY